MYDLPGTHVKCKTKSSFTSPSFYNKSICNTYIRVFLLGSNDRFKSSQNCRKTPQDHIKWSKSSWASLHKGQTLSTLSLRLAKLLK
ncbi:hypothetical protein V6Z12_D05G239800 [Gossypium hirsutum]